MSDRFVLAAGDGEPQRVAHGEVVHRREAVLAWEGWLLGVVVWIWLGTWVAVLHS